MPLITLETASQSDAFAVVAAIAGFVAVWYWYKSATMAPPPAAVLSSYRENEETGLTPIDKWQRDGATRNRNATSWTAVAVFLGAISSILGALS